MGDQNLKNAETIAKIMNDAGFDVVPVVMDLSSREAILNLIAEAQKYGPITKLVNGAGVSPSQAPIEIEIAYLIQFEPLIRLEICENKGSWHSKSAESLIFVFSPCPAKGRCHMRVNPPHWQI